MQAARSSGPRPMTFANRKSASRSILARLQRGGRVGQLEALPPQVGLRPPQAAVVAVGEAVEGGHAAGPGRAALDHEDELLAAEPALAQIGPVRHLVVHLAAVARPAVARLAVRLLAVDPHARADAGLGRLRLRQRGGARQARQARRAAAEHHDDRQRWPPRPSRHPGRHLAALLRQSVATPRGMRRGPCRGPPRPAPGGATAGCPATRRTPACRRARRAPPRTAPRSGTPSARWRRTCRRSSGCPSPSSCAGRPRSCS